MKPLIIDLDTPGWMSRRLRFASLGEVLIGLVLVAQFALTDTALRIVILIAGLGLLALPYIFPRVFKPRVLILDDAGITRSVGPRHGLTTFWGEILSVEVAESQIKLNLKDQHTVLINIANLTVEQYEEVESAIVDYIRAKRIDVQLT